MDEPSLQAALPVTRKATNPSTTWWLCDEHWAEPLAPVMGLVHHPDRIEPGSLLKRGVRRLVFRYAADDLPRTPVVIKSFPLGRLSKRLNHHRYAPSEAWNLVMAKQHGVSAPELFGYAEHRRYGLVHCNAVCMELIEGETLESHLDRCGDDAARKRLLDRVRPLFGQLYRAGCNHIDCGPQAILLADDPAGEDHWIDFQYCRFWETPSGVTLAWQAGYFGWRLAQMRPAIGGDLLDSWFGGLLEDVDLSKEDGMWDIFRESAREKKTIAERLAAR